MEEKINASGGVGFFGLLGIVFIVLKLTEVIDWNWAIVLLPLWIPMVMIIILFFFYIFAFIFVAIKKRK